MVTRFARPRFQRKVFKLDPKVLGKTTATGKHRDVLERRLASVAEAGCFHCGSLERTPQLVYHEGRERFAFDVLSNNEQRAARLRDLFKKPKKIFQAGNLLLMDQD
jgi:hypothetical protein